MKGRMLWIALAALPMVFAVQEAAAQRYPERRIVREGNALYGKENYPEAEIRYRKAQEKGQTYEGLFNLADALYKQKRYDEAAQLLTQISRDEVAGPHAADAFYNLGNTYFQQKKLPEAAEAYKNALRRNPSDAEAKYNLAYVLELMKQNQNDQNNKDNKNDQNKDNQQNQDQNKDQNKDNKDNKDQKQPPKKDQGDNKDKKDDQDKGDKGQGGENPPQDQKPGEGQPQEGRMSREEAERVLEAVQGSEDNTKKKVDARKVRAVGRSGKNW